MDGLFHGWLYNLRFLLFCLCVMLAGSGWVLSYVLNYLRHKLCSQGWPPQPWGSQSVGGCSPGCFWMFFFIKISGFFYIFVCCWLGLGGCSHMFGIALVTGCSPKDSLHHLGGPSLLVNVPLTGFGGPFYCNILGFLYFVCVAGWDWGVLP